MGPKIKYLIDTCSNQVKINGIDCVVFVPESLELILETIAWEICGMVIAEETDKTPYDCSRRVREEVKKYFGVE